MGVKSDGRAAASNASNGKLVRRITDIPNAIRAQEGSLQPPTHGVPMVVKLPPQGKQKKPPAPLEFPDSPGNCSSAVLVYEEGENEAVQRKLFDENDAGGNQHDGNRRRFPCVGYLLLFIPLGVLLIAFWATRQPIQPLGSLATASTSTVSTSMGSTTAVTTISASVTTATPTNLEDELHVSNLPATGRLPPIGNSLQILTNGLIYADATGKKSVMVSGRIRQVLSIFMDFPDSGEIKMLPRVTGRRLRVSNELQKCNNYSDWVECNVPLKLRAEVMRTYLTPRLKPGCLTRTGNEYPLTIQLRTNERCCGSQTYVQPPCAWYDELLGHENIGGPFSGAEIFADHKGHPCARDLLQRSGTGWMSGAKLTISSGDVYSDVCGILSSRKLVLPRSTFSFNLALLNPNPAKLFVPLPCEGCWLDGFLFFNFAKRTNVTHFLQEVCQVFPNSVAYAMPKTYMDVAAKMQNGEMLWREHFRGPHLKWVRSACIGTGLDTSPVNWVNV